MPGWYNLVNRVRIHNSQKIINWNIFIMLWTHWIILRLRFHDNFFPSFYIWWEELSENQKHASGRMYICKKWQWMKWEPLHFQKEARILWFHLLPNQPKLPLDLTLSIQKETGWQAGKKDFVVSVSCHLARTKSQ